MKSWTEAIASIICILTMLFGMYLYLDFKRGLENSQKEVLQVPQKSVEVKTFESKVNETKE